MPDLIAPANPDVGTPLRRRGSARRTSSIDTIWPEGYGKPMRMRGHARDIFSEAPEASPCVLAADTLDILASAGRTIQEIAGNRCDGELRQLIGQRAGGGYRSEIKRLFPHEQVQATPLNLLLDDFGGASLVAPWAWSLWSPDWLEMVSASSRADRPQTEQAPPRPSMAGTCVGYRPDSFALRKMEAGLAAQQNSAAVKPLPHRDDPGGWHSLGGHGQAVAHMRRARRLDVWVDGGIVHIDAHFQDSASQPGDADRRGVHEYRITATADRRTTELLSLTADPRILPYGECPVAASNTALLLGRRLADLRDQVPRTLAGTLGCTHLNDMLRSLSDVPALLRYLPGEE